MQKADFRTEALFCIDTDQLRLLYWMCWGVLPLLFFAFSAAGALSAVLPLFGRALSAPPAPPPFVHKNTDYPLTEKAVHDIIKY